MSAESKHTPDDGGSAFPLCVPLEFQFALNGMSLRDWFAGHALAGMCANQTWDPNCMKSRAVAAYEAADAMLIERAKASSEKVGS